MCRTFVIAGPIGEQVDVERPRIRRRSSSRPASGRRRHPNGIVPAPRRAADRPCSRRVSTVCISRCPNIVERPADHGSGPIRDEQHQVGDVCAACRERATPFGLDDVGRLAKAGGVDERDAKPVEIDRLGHEIARRARHLGDDRARRADERVEQARLPDVRRADDRDLQPFADQAAAARVGEQRRGPREQRRRWPSRARRARRSDSPRRENRPTPRAARSDRTAPRRSRAIVARQRAVAADRTPPAPAAASPRRSRSATASACIRSIRPFRYARSVNSPGSASRAPAAHRGRDDRLQHDRAAVRADLDDVVAGVRGGRGKVGHDDLIDRRPQRVDRCSRLDRRMRRQASRGAARAARACVDQPLRDRRARRRR